MATITKNKLGVRQFGGVRPPFGNETRLRYKLETNSSGAALDSDSSSAIESGDVVRLGEILGGLSLDDAVLNIVTAMTASVTGKLGFQYVDGVDDSDVPQDDDYFFAAGTDLASAAKLRASRALAPVVLPKPAYLILTTAGANNAKASEIHVLLNGEIVGVE